VIEDIFEKRIAQHHQLVHRINYNSLNVTLIGTTWG